MSGFVYRVHPAIGIARVGTSEKYYLGPETMAGFPAKPGSDAMGGLPIKACTEDELITSADIPASRIAELRGDGELEHGAQPEGAGGSEELTTMFGVTRCQLVA